MGFYHGCVEFPSDNEEVQLGQPIEYIFTVSKLIDNIDVFLGPWHLVYQFIEISNQMEDWR